MTATSGALAGKAPARLHLAHVEGLRAVAALTVFVNHAYAHTWSPLREEFPDGVLSLLSYSLVAGHLAVTVFIVISGFVLALPVSVTNDRLRNGVGDYIKRRARRILPAYYGAVALCLFLIATVIGEPTGSPWDVPIQVTWVSVVSHVLLLQDLYATGSINYVFWSIAVEWQLYFLFPLILIGFRRLGVVRTVLLALVLGFTVALALSGTRIARANPHYLGLFSLGMLGAYLVRSERPELRFLQTARIWPWLSGAMLAVAMVLCGYWGFARARENFPYLDLPVGVFAFALLVHSSRQEGSQARRVLGWKPIVKIGTFSYSVYLLHAPVIQLLTQYVLEPLGLGKIPLFVILMTAGGAVVLAASYGFFLVFEAPFLRKTGRLQSMGRLTQTLAPTPERSRV